MSDFRREYHMPGDQLAALSAHEFRMLMSGLSSRSRFAHAWHEAPKHMYDPDEIAALTAAARR